MAKALYYLAAARAFLATTEKPLKWTRTQEHAVAFSSRRGALAMRRCLWGNGWRLAGVDVVKRAAREAGGDSTEGA